MRIVVTGSRGQVARALCDLAIDAKAEVLTVSRPNFDLENASTIAAPLRAANPDIIINAAAWTAVDLAETEFARVRAINEKGARVVAEVAAELAVPIIQISTNYVFDGTKGTPYVETDPTGPTSVYGATKRAGEIAVAAAQPDHAIIRTASIYAAEGKNFVRSMLNFAATRDEVSVVGDRKGNPTFATDIAAGIFVVARNLLASPRSELRGTFHMTATGEASWAHFAEAIFAISKARGGPAARVRWISSSEYPAIAQRPASSLLDCSRIERVHDVRLPSWSDGLERCLSQMLAHQNSGAAQ